MANPLDPVTGLPTAPTDTPATPAIPAVTPSLYTAPTYTPGQNFTFDTQTVLPQIQQQASSIYDPQKANLEALQKVSQAQTAQTKITTEKQFQNELNARIEAINARGAFFGGGAIVNQNDINERKTSALTNLDLQQQASDLATQAQQAGLSVAQQQYIQDKLTGAQNSAYSMWKDQYDMYTQQKQMEQAQANADRQYALDLKRIEDDESASKASKKAASQKLKADKATSDSELAYKYAALKTKGTATTAAEPTL